MLKFRLLAATAVPLLGAGLLLTAGAASASTPACTAGAYDGYCATQVDNETPALVIDSKGQSATYGTEVIGWTDSITDPATDFFQLPYAGNSSLGVMFQYAPDGTLSNMCLSDPGNALVVLRPCNGSDWQRWIASQVGSSSYYTWTNLATQRILQANGPGAQLTTVIAPTTPTTPAGAQQWMFSD